MIGTLPCSAVWSDPNGCDEPVGPPTWRHGDHPRPWHCHESPLRSEPVLADDVPFEVVCDLWLDPELQLGLGSFSKAGLVLDQIFDDPWDYAGLHPSRTVLALIHLDVDDLALAWVAGRVQLPASPAEALKDLWGSAAHRPAAALGLTARRDTPATLLDDVLAWSVSRVSDPMAWDATARAAARAGFEAVRSAVAAGSAPAAVGVVSRPEPLDAGLAERCADLLLCVATDVPPRGRSDGPCPWEGLVAWDTLDVLVGRADCPPELVARLVALQGGAGERMLSAFVADEARRSAPTVLARLEHWDPSVRIDVTLDPTVPAAWRATMRGGAA